MAHAQERCDAPKPKVKQTSVGGLSSKEIKSLAAAVVYGTADIATTYNPDWKWVKYGGKALGLGIILSIFLEAGDVGANNDFAAYYKKHPDKLQKLKKLSDNQLKVLVSADESGEFADLIKKSRTTKAR